MKNRNADPSNINSRSRRTKLALVAGATVATGLALVPQVRTALVESFSPPSEMTTQLDAESAARIQTAGKSSATSIIGFAAIPWANREKISLSSSQVIDETHTDKNGGIGLTTHQRVTAAGDTMTVEYNSHSTPDSPGIHKSHSTVLQFENTNVATPATMTTSAALEYIADPSTRLTGFEAEGTATYVFTTSANGKATLSRQGFDTGGSEPLSGLNFDAVRDDPRTLPDLVEEQLLFK